MYLCNRWPGQTFWPLLLGSVEEAAGLGALTWAVSASRPNFVSGMMVLTGAGTGSRFMPASLHVAGVWPERLAPAMSLMRFAMPFGGTLGLTIMNAVFNSKFASATSSLSLPSGSGNIGNIIAQDSQSLDAITKLPSALQTAVREAGRSGVKWAFISILPLLGLSILACFVLGNVWIKHKVKKGEAASSTSSGQGEKQDTRASAVVYVPYLYALLKVTMSDRAPTYHVSQLMLLLRRELIDTSTSQQAYQRRKHILAPAACKWKCHSKGWVHNFYRPQHDRSLSLCSSIRWSM